MINSLTFSKTFALLSTEDKQQVIDMLNKHGLPAPAELALEEDITIPIAQVIQKEEDCIYPETFYIRKPTPKSAAELELYLLAKKANTKTWKYEKPIVSPGLVEWKLTDGAHISATLNIYKRGKEFLVDCDCKDFNTPLNACQHSKLFELVLANRGKTFAYDALGNACKQSTPSKTLPLIKYYDFQKKKMLFFGNIKATTSIEARTCKQQNTSTTNFRKLPSREEVFAIAPANKQPRDYQIEGLNCLLKTGRAALAMPIGSGKTLTAILATIIANPKKILCVAPKSLLSQWKDCFQEFADIKSEILSPASIKKWESSEIPVGLITYQGLMRALATIDISTDLLILDEIQNIKNSDTKVWKAISNIKTTDIYGLSGTPIENSLEDLFNVMEIIKPGLLGAKWQFQDEHQLLTTSAPGKAVFSGSKNVSGLIEKLKDHLYVCMVETKPVNTVENIVEVIPDATQRTISNDFWKSAKDLQAKALTAENPGKLKLMVQAMLLRARQAACDVNLTQEVKITSSNKTNAILDQINVFVKNNEQVCVYSQWTSYLEILSSQVTVPYSYFHGGLSVKQRSAEIEKFITGKTKIFFCSDAGQTGIDGLQRASSNIIHCEPSWNPAVVKQRTGRLNRIGQTIEVKSYIFISKGTIDEHVLNLSRTKQQISTDVLG